jgi:hypothetical protein
MLQVEATGIEEKENEEEFQGQVQIIKSLIINSSILLLILSS